jgi:hypothetical protein
VLFDAAIKIEECPSLARSFTRVIDHGPASAARDVQPSQPDSNEANSTHEAGVWHIKSVAAGSETLDERHPNAASARVSKVDGH